MATIIFRGYDCLIFFSLIGPIHEVLVPNRLFKQFGLRCRSCHSHRDLSKYLKKVGGFFCHICLMILILNGIT